MTDTEGLKTGDHFQFKLYGRIPCRHGKPSPVLDFNMDGNVDFAVRNNKGNLILHRGGRDFEALDANPLLVEHGFADLDNDGFPSWWMLRSGFMHRPSFMSTRVTTPILKMTLDDGDGGGYR